LYQQYNGKESHFWEAQRLTLHDCNVTDLKQAFVNIVSGIEDMKDAQMALGLAVKAAGKALAEELSPQRDLGSAPPEERELVQARMQFFHTAMMRQSVSPQEEARRLYVVTKPQLGLARS
jgi:hypothetical protein